jgi:hypothetical protein
MWRIALPDLRSRLTATPHVEIAEPDDALIGSLVMKRLGDRGVAVPPELPAFLIPRIERSYVAVQQVVDALDRAALSHHRRMTVAMAKSGARRGGHDEEGEKPGMTDNDFVTRMAGKARLPTCRRASATSTASFPGSPSTAGSSTRRATRPIPCSSGCASCRSRATISTNSSWCGSPG